MSHSSSDTFDATAPLAGHYLPACEMVGIVLTSLLVGMRLYSRAFVIRTLGLDDLFVFIALLFAIAVTISHLLAVRYGWGRHIDQLYHPDAVKMYITEFLHWITYPPCSMFTKLSILCFYLRFATTRRFRIAIFATMGLVVAYTVGLGTAVFFVCRPISVWWGDNTEMVKKKCLSPATIGNLIFMQAALNLSSDVIIFVMPIRTVWKINASRTKKVMMVGLLGLGLIICLIAMLRIKFIIDLSTNSDTTWYGYSLFLWVALELDLCIACACLPFCKHAFSKPGWARTVARSFTSVAEIRKSIQRSVVHRTRIGIGSRSEASRVMSKATSTTTIKEGDVEKAIVHTQRPGDQADEIVFHAMEQDTKARSLDSKPPE